MEANQKFFPVLGADGRLTEHFIGIANIESKDEAEIRKGYERVIRPRFADAKFFFVEDLKQGLASMNDGLAIRHLPGQARQRRRQGRARRRAGRGDRAAGRRRSAARAPRRGTVEGRPAVAHGQRIPGTAGHRRPLLRRRRQTSRSRSPTPSTRPTCRASPRDDIALSPLGKVLAIAERLDTLAGGFAAGLKPTGNKDPFALRRNALGLARTIIESGFDIDLIELLASACDRLQAASRDRGKLQAHASKASAAAKSSA